MTASPLAARAVGPVVRKGIRIGVVAGAVLGALVGTVALPVIGTAFGLIFGAIYGLPFGVANGIALAAVGGRRCDGATAAVTGGLVSGCLVIAFWLYAGPANAAGPPIAVAIGALGAVLGPRAVTPPRH